MRRVSVWIGCLGLLLATLAAILAVVRSADWLGYLLLAGAGGGALVLAAAGAVGERRSERPGDLGRRRLPDLSLPTVLLVIGVATALDGLAFGLWLILIGLLIAALGAAALVRELVDERRDPT